MQLVFGAVWCSISNTGIWRTYEKIWRTYGKIWPNIMVTIIPRTYGNLHRTYGNLKKYEKILKKYTADIWDKMADMWQQNIFRTYGKIWRTYECHPKELGNGHWLRHGFSRAFLFSSTIDR
jgi:hypothetical protein